MVVIGFTILPQVFEKTSMHNMGFLCTHGAHIRKISFIILLGCQDFEKHLGPRCPGTCMARCTYQLPKTSMDPWLSGGAWDDETRIFFHLFWCYFIVSCQNGKVTKTIKNPSVHLMCCLEVNSTLNITSIQNTFYKTHTTVYFMVETKNFPADFPGINPLIRTCWSSGVVVALKAREMADCTLLLVKWEVNQQSGHLTNKDG